ncbi:MAG: proline dehydrogenase family protein [Bacteroidota bacterium]|nr:proline dehydrogenase family protein [Bacteroidota bacterium]
MRTSVEREDRELDLGDTRIAFSDRTDRELREARLLFQVLGSPALSNIGQKTTLFALSIGLPVIGMIKRTIFKQFCGGETIEESLRTAERLATSNIGTILDHSVEGQESEDLLDGTVEEIIRTIQVAQTRKDVPFCVFKPSGIGRMQILEKVSQGSTLDAAQREEWDHVEKRVDRLCAAAYTAGIPILIDAEESWIQQAIDDLIGKMMQRYNQQRVIVFNTIQFYRHDRLAFLKESLERSKRDGYHLGVKLVRGAYMEKERERAKQKGYPSPIHPDKKSVDRDYDEALKICIEHIDRMAIVAGSHNEHSSILLTQLINAQRLSHNDPRIYFSQLLGMSDNISYNLAASGYNVMKYVPYGPVQKVIPYLIRRAAENTSVAGQTSRELQMIREELMRRKIG